jgi:glycosyltransferase involved in cell wall biosynthesis
MPKKKSILFFIPSMSGGGAERQLAYLCNSLSDFRWEIHLAVLSGGPNLNRINNENVKIHRIKKFSNYDPLVIWRLVRLIKLIKPTLIQTWLPTGDFFGGISAILTKTPFIISERNSSGKYSERNWKIKIRIRIAKKSVLIIANSNAGLNYWKNLTHRFNSILVIHNALPLKEIDNFEKSQKKKLNLREGQKIILYAGRLVSHKNVENLIYSLKQILQNDNLVLMICGEGEELENLKAVTYKLNLVEKIKFLGYRNDLWGLMKISDVFISISKSEGMPNTIMEAMACGCPVIASDIEPHREIINNECGILVELDKLDSLQSKIETLFSDDALRLKLIKRARNNSELWDIWNFAMKYHVSYTSILENKSEQTY